MRYKKIEDVPKEKWQELAKKKIYFGHQSVGFNIVDGMQAVMKEHPEIQLNIVESRNNMDPGGAFVHSKIGENRKPVTKINDFVKVINQDFGVTPDAAALKFCYVDAHDKIDINDLFQQYKEAMSTLKKEHPDLVIIHFTMPLRTQPISWKTKAKLFLGKEPWEFADNIKRNQFNQLLSKEYQEESLFFDIAWFEAMAENGTIIGFKYKGKEYLAMNPKFSSDGGHLNEEGRRIVAEALLVFFVNNLLSDLQ